MTAASIRIGAASRLIVVVAMLASPAAFASSGKSANECSEEIGDQPTAAERESKMVACMLGDNPANTKLFKAPFKGGKWFCEVAKGAKCEEGYAGSLDGVRFRQDPDGGGFVQGVAESSPSPAIGSGGWTVNCKRDAMTQRSFCSANLDDLWLFADHNGRIKVSVGYKHFPRSQTSLRIDARRFDTMDEDGNFPQSAEILRQLKDGRTLVTRYMQWPNRHWIDVERTLYGAEATIQLLTWSARNLR